MVQPEHPNDEEGSCFLELVIACPMFAAKDHLYWSLVRHPLYSDRPPRCSVFGLSIHSRGLDSYLLMGLDTLTNLNFQ